jgi:prepilin-type N-terminal cleavage/methylation domain-containing protein
MKGFHTSSKEVPVFKSARGFTLIELLVVAVLALVGGVCGGVIYKFFSKSEHTGLVTAG